MHCSIWTWKREMWIELQSVWHELPVLWSLSYNLQEASRKPLVLTILLFSQSSGHRFSNYCPDNPNMLSSRMQWVDCHNHVCCLLPSPSSDGFGGVPHQLYRLPARGPLALKIWAVLLYHGHIVSSFLSCCHFFLKHNEPAVYCAFMSFPPFLLLTCFPPLSLYL